MAQAGIGNLGGGLGKFTELRQRLLFVIGALIVLAVILLLGFASGLPLALSGQTLQAWMTQSGLSLATIGVAMVWLVRHHPADYDMGKELVRFMLLAVVVVSMWQVTNADTEEQSSAMRTLLSWIFTDDPKQRLRIQRFMVAAANFVICTVVLAYAVAAGLFVVAFTWLADAAYARFAELQTRHWWAPLLWTPAVTAAPATPPATCAVAPISRA